MGSSKMLLAPRIAFLFILLARWRAQVFWQLGEQLGRVKSELEEISILAEFCAQEENVVWGKLQLSRDKESVEKGKLMQLQEERRELVRRKIMLSKQRQLSFVTDTVR